MKQFIRKILNGIGYDIVKINTHSEDKAFKKHTVRVGQFPITMPGNNPLLSHYKYQPDLNSQLGRLSKIVQSKYADLTVLDIGANVGDTVAVIKSQCNVPIIAVEGDDTSYSFMKRNIEQFKDVYIINQFLGEEDSTVKVNLDKKGWNTTLVPGEEGHGSIQLKTLDQTLKDESLFTKKIKVLKTDVEGFDTIILRGASEIIKTYKPILYFEYNVSNMKAINEDGLATLLSLETSGYNSVIFFDAKNRYIITLPLSEKDLITQMHYYVDEKNSMIPYYDLCLFHEEDLDLQETFIENEFKLNIE